MLRALLLDLMETVVVDPYVEAVQAGSGLDLQTAHVYKDPDIWPRFELGEVDEATFERGFFLAEAPHSVDGPPPTFDAAAFHRARREGYAWIDGMRELLAALEGRVDRHVASNYPVWIEELREHLDLDAYFEGVWASYELGARKPDAAFYERLLERVGVEPEQCLFVDDREENCTAARASGLPAHRFVGVVDLRARLRAEGLAL